MKRFLIKNGSSPKEALLLAIIRRFDLDADAKLKLDEFSSGIKSQDGFSKRALKESNTLSSLHGKTKNSSRMGESALKSSMRSTMKSKSSLMKSG